MTATATLPQSQTGTPAARKLPRILCVDDDEYVLAFLKRSLRTRFEVDTANVPVVALRQLIESGESPYAVVVSDLVMPGIDGVSLLSRAREICPDTVRILLTGHAQVDGAIGAVNDGAVFRFLTKPCSATALITTITAAAEHYRLALSERVLLEQTLHGAVKAITDILTLVNPSAFARGTRLKRSVNDVAEALGVTNQWEVEIAALLSQLGAVSLPAELVEKLHVGHDLDPDEQRLVDGIPAMAASFIGEIPRLEEVVQILLFQSTAFDGRGSPRPGVRGTSIPLGARILKVATDLDWLQSSGMTSRVALWTLNSRPDTYDPKVLEAFKTSIERATSPVRVRYVRLGDVQPGMIFARDVLTPTGLLMAARGQEVGRALTERLRHSWSGSLLDQEVLMMEPAAGA
ncbi:MAG TPA: HD domain-containing phosphohydrolase [Gemmatimonadaceae bacterium]|jgi:response regulator RpfG family c-di-GMP phosphodiesterase